MIKIISGFTGPGGSTVAFNNLTNLFNSKGLDACFYGPNTWKGINCRFDSLTNFRPNKEDVVIYHFLKVTEPLDCKKIILSCHETNLFPIRNMTNLKYDNLHFVSEFQKNWQNLPGVIIPNVVSKYPPKAKKSRKRIAGILGSLDRNKRIPLSVERALRDGHNDIRLYGAATQVEYFFKEIVPLLGDKVSYRGPASNMAEVYSIITDVYHSPELETFNLIKAECHYAEVAYHGNEGNDTQAEYWDEDRIFEAWKKLL